MGAVAPEELARLWVQEGITTERAVGQIVQQLVTIQTTVERQAIMLAQLRAEVAALAGKLGDGAERVKRNRRDR